MRKVVLAGMFAFMTSTCLAQTTTPPQPADPAIKAPSAQAAASPSGPANLCQEILAFMRAPEPEEAGGAAGKPAATSGEQKPSTQQAASEGKKSGTGEQGTSALAGTTAAGEGASTKPTGESSSAQKITGQDGVATDAPQPGKDGGGSGSVANAPQKDTRSAPTPPADVTSTPKEAVLTVEAAEQLAGANDIAQCQKTAREMRVAGVAMPPPLIALAALDLQYLQKSAAPTEPPGGADPAAGETAAPQ